MSLPSSLATPFAAPDRRVAERASSSLRRAIGAATLMVVLVFGWTSSLASAPESRGPTADRLYERGVHIVRPGETLRDITRYYLGSDDLWRENQRLNPQIKNPDLILPGQRIRVLREPTQGVPNALLTQVAGRVEERPMPRPWDRAQVRDLLLERDGIRTYEDSSTRMRFPDGTSVLLTEDTLVFLRRSGTQLRGVESKSIEIVEGQAEILAQLEAGDQTEVEILVAGAVATSKLDEKGISHTRAKRVEGVGGFVMVYEGSGEVEAAGEKVQLDRGMGTAVADNQPPSPPEVLLPAPEILLPPANSTYDFANPGFEWKPVQDAASYTVEVCRDDLCGDLVFRETGLTDLRWRAPQPLPVEEMFWRVTAMGTSGLDGYPSAAWPLSITSDRLDTTPPTGDLQIVGNVVWVDGALVVDETVKFRSNLTDSESGLGTQSPWVNGRPAPPSFWEGPWKSGDFEAKVVAADRSGNVDETAPVVFTVDAEPPVIDWQLTHRRNPHRLSARHSKWTAQGVKWLEWSVDGEKWRPLVWGDSDSPIRRYIDRLGRRDLRPSSLLAFEVRSSRPQVLFRAPAGEVFTESETLTLRDDQVLKLFADDLPAGVNRLRVRIDGGESDEPSLLIEAIDHFGHKNSLSWNLVSQIRRTRSSS